MPQIIDSYMLGAFDGVAVFAETCSKHYVDGDTYLARIVECPAGAPDNVALMVDNLADVRAANVERSRLADSYCKSH